MSSQESQTHECKRSLAEWREIVETVAALATVDGGTIEVGIDPSGRVVGCDVGKHTLEDLANKIHQNTDPSQAPALTAETRDGRTVIVLRVAECTDKPVSAFGVPVKRVGRSNRRLSMAETRQMLAETGVGRWEDRICEDVAPDELSADALAQFADRAQRRLLLPAPAEAVPSDLPARLGLVREGHLTRAAVALFGREPSRVFPQLELRCAVFAADMPVDFRDLEVVSGTLFSQIEGAVQFVCKNMRRSITIGAGPEREEFPEYSVAAVREVMTNAVCHRDYGCAGHVQVRILPDRLEVWSPGLLVPGITVEALRGAHRSLPRNPLMARVLFWAGYIEQWGTGTNRVIVESGRNLCPPPEFVERPETDSFVVVLHKSVVARARDAGSDLGERQVAALLHVRQHGQVSTRVLSERFGVHRHTARRDLAELVDAGILEAVGAGRGAHYVFAGQAR